MDETSSTCCSARSLCVQKSGSAISPSSSARRAWSRGKSKIPPQLAQARAEGRKVDGTEIEGHGVEKVAGERGSCNSECVGGVDDRRKSWDSLRMTVTLSEETRKLVE